VAPQSRKIGKWAFRPSRLPIPHGNGHRAPQTTAALRPLPCPVCRLSRRADLRAQICGTILQLSVDPILAGWWLSRSLKLYVSQTGGTAHAGSTRMRRSNVIQNLFFGTRWQPLCRPMVLALLITCIVSPVALGVGNDVGRCPPTSAPVVRQ